MFNPKTYQPLHIATGLIFDQLEKMSYLDYSYNDMKEHVTTDKFLTWLQLEIESRYCYKPDIADLAEKINLMLEFKSVRDLFKNNLQ